MSVSDSVSDSTQKKPKSASLTRYGEGSIWVETRSNNRKVWVVEIVVGIKPDGKPQKTRRTASCKSEAVALRHELNLLKAQNALAIRSSELFAEFAIDWVRTYKVPSIKEATAADYEYRIRQYINPYLGNKRIQDIGPRDIQHWANNLLAHGLSAKTINGARRVMFGVFRHAQRQGTVSVNPVALTDHVKAPEGAETQVRQHWSREEVIAVLNAARATPEMDLFIHLAIYCGLRHGEILGLTWECVDLAAATITVKSTMRSFVSFDEQLGPKRIVRFTAPKTTSSNRVLPFDKALDEAICRHKQWQQMRRQSAGANWIESDLVFTTGIGTPISISNNTRAFAKFVSKNRLRKIRIHDMRHTSAVLALEAGAPLESVAQALGHRGTEITKTVYAPYVKRLNEKFSESLNSLLAQ